MKICYHGTKVENVESIQKHGFWSGSWFSRHLEDAVGFGGEHVFEVCFEDPPDHWQFLCPHQVSPEQIVSYKVYRIQSMYENDDLRKAVFESN